MPEEENAEERENEKEYQGKKREEGRAREGKGRGKWTEKEEKS